MLRYLLQTPRSTPLPALCWDFGVFPMQYRVSQRKLNFLKHITDQKNSSLSKQVFNVQNSYQLPGLVSQTKITMNKLNLPDITNNKTNEKMKKVQWKSQVNKALKKECENDLKSELLKMKKLKSGEMKNETFSFKTYLNEMTVADARLKFKLRSHMFDAKYNYSHNPQFTKELWRCDSCQRCIETQSHIIWCPAYSNLREGKDLNSDKDLINYMKNVIKYRDKLNLTK